MCSKVATVATRDRLIYAAKKIVGKSSEGEAAKRRLKQARLVKAGGIISGIASMAVGPEDPFLGYSMLNSSRGVVYIADRCIKKSKKQVETINNQKGHLAEDFVDIYENLKHYTT